MEEVNQTFSLINNKKIDVLELSTILLILASIFSIINLRLLKLPQTIGLMILAIALSISSLLLGLFFPSILNLAYTITESFDFNFVLINVMLPFLLFAGAISINVHQLLKDKITILFLALFGVLFSTYVIGNLTFILIQLPIFGLESIGITYIDCLLFGALIAPTDPIAVLSIIKKMNLSPITETRIAGESLFNDGIGVVVFLTLLGVKTSGTVVTVESVSSLFFTEVIGGIALGAIIGYLGLKLVRYIENEHVELEVLLTISMVLLLSVIATRFHLSGPLGVVILGLFLNKHADSKSDSNQEKAMGDYVYKFWHLLDETLNAILFILIGLEIILLFESFNIVYLLLSIITIIIVVATRWVGVSIPILILSIFKNFEKNTALIITWGGLRGGLSIALALNLPDDLGDVKSLILILTYGVVLFTILVQGLTMKRIVKYK
jgi:monovalent cation:H+ antiporter, CPA1 family|tara:strand:+ start:22981 stop:24294 length:1314 start_codon:yes stop_codon:yes gene_type:complete